MFGKGLTSAKPFRSSHPASKTNVLGDSRLMKVSWDGIGDFLAVEGVDPARKISKDL